MKIAYLAARQSVHTVRWVNALAQRGYTIYLITLHDGGEPLDDRIAVFKLPIPAPPGYLLNAPFLKPLLQRLHPDILHVHYASGYGTLGRLSQFQPLLLSVWGSDVFDFPAQSRWHRAWLVKNLQAAKLICSTSQVMAEVTRALLASDAFNPAPRLTVIPFGIDTTVFYPRPELRNPTLFKIGTVKTLAPKYGIDTLIHAFHQVRLKLLTTQPELANQLRLCIAGGGPQRVELQNLVNQLELTTVTELAGELPHSQVPNYLNQLEIYVAASRLESFGVAILEASACGLPVVVSRVGGLPEVVRENVTGLLVEKDNVAQFTQALLTLIQHPRLRHTMGAAGIQWVKQQYDWQNNVTALERIYDLVAMKSG